MAFHLVLQRRKDGTKYYDIKPFLDAGPLPADAYSKLFVNYWDAWETKLQAEAIQREKGPAV
jgi:hypothetical protein